MKRTTLVVGTEFPARERTPRTAGMIVGMALAIVTASGGGGSAAPGDPIGNEFQVNTHTPYYQSDPAVSADGSGGFVVVWQSSDGNGTDTSSYSVHGRRYDSSGTPVGAQFQVNTYTTGAQGLPAVSPDGAGGFVVVWQSDGSNGTDTDYSSIQGQRYDASGTPVGGEFQVNTYTTGSQFIGAVGQDGAGGLVVVWQSDGSGGTDTFGFSIQGQRYDSNGAAVGVQFQVNTYTTGDVGPPVVSPDGAGGFVVVWPGRSYGTDTDSGSVQGQRYDGSGVPVGGQFQINSYTTGSQYAPAVGRDGSSGFMVAWSSRGSSDTDTDGTSIQAQRFDGSGTPVGGEFQVNAYTTADQFFPAVGTDGAGGFVVVWESEGSSGTDTSSYSVQGRRYDANGSAVGGEFQVNSYTTDGQSNPAIGPDGTGGFVVAWDSYGSSGTDTSGRSVQAQRFEGGTTGTGAATGTFTVTLDTSVFPPFPLMGTATFDDVMFDVFGTAVNLGTAVGALTLDGTGGEFTGVPASSPFSLMAASTGPSPLDFDVLGHSICTSPACTSGTWTASFVGDLLDVDDPTGILPANPDIVYVDDGTMQCTSLVGSAECAGTFALNAFLSRPTPADPGPVTVAFSNVVLPPVEGASEISSDIEVTYASVETAGRTLMTVKSNVPNFSLGTSVPLATFFDVSTTAEVTAPIVLCATYADANDNGMLDVSNDAIHECGLRIYHFEDRGDGVEEYVDKTLAAADPECPLTLPATPVPCALADGQAACLHRTDDKLCGVVDELSPFALAVVSDGDIPVAATKLVVVDKTATVGKAKVVFVSKDRLAGITKGVGTDVGAIETTLAFGYGPARGVFLAPAGAGDASAGWLANKTAVAKYVNKAAPSGPTGAKIVVIKPEKLLKLVGKSLGDAAIDIQDAGPPTTDVRVVYTIQNGGQRFRHCTAFPMSACSHKPIAAGQGAKLVCKGGLPAPCG